jgi:hypothetical protein
VSVSNRRLIYIVFGLTLLIALLHHSALAFFLYFKYWWFDIVVHFLGGLLVGTIIYWLLSYTSKFTSYFRNPSLLLVVLIVLVVGGSWEIFELYAGVLIEENYEFDTSVDLVMDALGAAAAFFFANITKNTHESRTRSQSVGIIKEEL